MRNLSEQLTQYAAYHRDRRNILTHFVGIPMIVLAVAVLLARPVLAQWGAVALSPATLVTLLTVLYYLKLDLRLGAVMAARIAHHRERCDVLANAIKNGATTTAGIMPSLFNRKLDDAWDEWIAFEKQFQKDQLAKLSAYPLTDAWLHRCVNRPALVQLRAKA